MAYTAIPTYVTNQLITAAHGNTYWKENISTLFPYTTAGDIAYASSASVLARLGIGTAGQVLRTNSGANAPEWSNGDMALIEKKLLTSPAASFNFINIPNTFSHLQLILHARTDRISTIDYLYLTFNGDSGNNYDYRTISTDEGANTVSSSSTQAQASLLYGVVTGSNAPSGIAGSVDALIPNYSGTTFRKNIISKYFLEEAQSTPNDDLFLKLFGGHWRNTAAINQITITPVGNFIVGSIASLYGII